MLDFRLPKPIFRNLSANPDKQDLSRYVISLRTHKQQGPQAGTWEVNLVPSPDINDSSNYTGTGVTLDNWESEIYRSISTMDAVLVGMEATNHLSGRHEDNIFMFGFVDGVFKTKVRYGDSVQRGLCVRGKDATKLFIRDEVALAPELAIDEKLRGVIGDKRAQFMSWIRGLINDGKDNIFLDSNPVEAMYWLLANIPAMRIMVNYFNGQSTPLEVFQTTLLARAEDRLFDANMNMYSGTVQNYMNQLLDMMFYEIWVDTVPPNSPLSIDCKTARPILIVRPKPYDRTYEIDTDGNPIPFDGLTNGDLPEGFDSFNKKVPTKAAKLPAWDGTDLDAVTSPITNVVEIIRDGDIIRSGLGVSDEEVFTMFKMAGTKDVIASSLIGRFGYYFPLIDADMLKIFGLRELQGQSRYISPANDIPREAGADQTGLTEEDLAAKNNIGVPQSLRTTPKLVDRATALEILNGSDMSRINSIGIASFLTKEKRDRLWRHNRFNHLYESGQATIKGRNMFVGTKTILPDETPRARSVDDTEFPGGMEYYCVGVSQSYQFGNPWETDLDLIRGHNPNHIKQYHDRRGFNRKAGDGNNIFVRQEFSTGM